jgi:hypothetical protein
MIGGHEWAGARRLLSQGLLIAATVVGVVGAVVVEGSSLLGLRGLLLASGLTFTMVGAVIVARSDAGKVGGALSLIGISLLTSGLLGDSAGTDVASAGAPISGVATILVQVGTASRWATFGGIGMLMAWFPTGATAGRRWRWLTPFGLTVTALWIALSLLSERVCVASDDSGCISWAANPIGLSGVPDPEYEAGPVLGLLIVFLLVAAVSLVVRFTRSEGVERLQLKWFTAAVGWFAVFMVGAVAIDVFGHESFNAVGEVIMGLSLWALPVAVGVAVTRFRLYDIDRIVSRTLSYTLVAGVVVGIYVLPVLTLPRLLGESNDLVIAASTLAAAAAFTPARRRIQRTVDHRFNRSAYDAERELEHLSAKLRSALTVTAVTEDLTGVVVRTVQPGSLGLWIRDRH